MPTNDPPQHQEPQLAETAPATPSTPDGLDHGRRLFSDAFPAGAVLSSRYRITKRLGAGGMGTVYSARDLTLDQEVALKFLSSRLTYEPESVAALMNEVRLARQVSHPNVCLVHDVGEIDGRPFISMEYVDGKDLSSLRRRIGRLPGDRVEQIARQLCAGLHAAHENGVLHRDLKPANVMLDADGNVKITDFGIAAAIGGGQNEEGTSGTPGYMAPELFTGSPASVQSDIYSLGIVLYELYTGRRLFKASSMTELLELHRRPIPRPSDLVREIDPDLEELILACLSRERERRPSSAMAVLARLPGSTVLADAMARGQTPSPELVAICGGSGRL